jgi:hypothetical protein
MIHLVGVQEVGWDRGGSKQAAFEDLDDEVDINIACEITRVNIKTSAKEGLGYYELKNHKSWFDK